MFIQTRTSKLLSLFSCKKWRKSLRQGRKEVREVPVYFINIQYTILHILSFSHGYVFSFIKDVNKFLYSSATVCVGVASAQLTYWKTGEAELLEKTLRVSQFTNFLLCPPKKSKSTSYWEISDWKKRLWSGMKAFSFDLCWNAKYVSVWTFVLTRWRSKQRWACWKRT